MKVWNWNNAGELIVAIEVADMDEARSLARQWNRLHTAKQYAGKVVATITNSRVQAEATKITAIG